MTRSILVLGAHPDDCEIGAGGTMALYARMGYTVHLVTLRVPCQCEGSCHAEQCLRWRETGEAARVLGASPVALGLPREAVQPAVGLVSTLDQMLAALRPAAVFTHWIGDSHPEHWGTTRAVLAATRRNQCSVYMYEESIPGGITPHAFCAQKFIDISDTLDLKMTSLACHQTQVQSYGPQWLEAIRGRAARRGFQIGCRYAEAFQVIKEVGPIPHLGDRVS